MNTDGDDLTRKRKATARIVCLVGVVLVLIPLLGLRWMRAGHDIDAGVSLLFVEICGEDYDGNHRCESHSNLDVVDKVNDGMPDDKQILGTFAYAGIATIFFAVIGVGALGTAAVLAFKDKFIRTPVALTTVALLGLSLSLICGCIFLGSIPKMPFGGGVGWPFFLYGVGIVTGLAGAQMLAKAFSEVRDPYWDGQMDSQI